MVHKIVIRRSQLLAAQGLIEMSERGNGEVNDLIRAYAAAQPIPGTDEYLVVYDPEAAPAS